MRPSMRPRSPHPAHGISFSEATRVWLRVAALSFGGPAGQIAVMHRILVDEKRWVGETLFLHALNLAAFAPNLALALALLLVRAALSQMDVPTRSSYVMAVVTPAERPAAASFTSVPRSLAAAASPAIAGALFAASFQVLPLLICGTLKITYDLLLLRQFRRVKPPEER